MTDSKNALIRALNLSVLEAVLLGPNNFNACVVCDLFVIDYGETKLRFISQKGLKGGERYKLWLNYV